MPSPRKPKTAKAETAKADPSTSKQPSLAAWLRQMATFADEGKVNGFLATALIEGISNPITFVCDPANSFERMAMAGSVAQLAHMLHDTEHKQRMASLAARPDPIS